MLTRLSITNYALIDRLDFQPGEGLSIITGETGAGKSIMLGALGLLMGDRADMKVIADKDKKAVVEASFTALDSRQSDILEKIDSEWDGTELIIRREIYPSGKSRAFVNDSPATLGQLQELSRGLLDIHSQNSNSILGEQKMQLELVDSFSDTASLLAEYEKEFSDYASLRQRIRKLKEDAQTAREHREIIAFRLEQLNRLKPKGGELKKVESRYEAMSKSEEIKSALTAALRSLSDDQATGAIERIENAAEHLSGIDFSLWEEEDPQIVSRLNQTLVELKDILDTVEGAMETTEYSAEAHESLSRRMKDYYTALKAFKVESDAELEEIHKELQRQFNALEKGDDDTAALEAQAKKKAASLKRIAAEITERRRKGAEILQGEIERQATKLGLPNLKFEISVSDTKLTRTGGDRVEFLATFNKSGDLRAVAQIASGGEMARLMLAIKNIMATSVKLPTIVFDEIDTGVSGSIANAMGEMMREMGRKMQILTITHLPQVAVKGERHFKVYKEDRDDKTISDVKLLTEAEREEEIGRMLSGEQLDKAAMENARSLLKK